MHTNKSLKTRKVYYDMAELRDYDMLLQEQHSMSEDIDMFDYEEPLERYSPIVNLIIWSAIIMISVGFATFGFYLAKALWLSVTN